MCLHVAATAEGYKVIELIGFFMAFNAKFTKRYDMVNIRGTTVSVTATFLAGMIVAPQCFTSLCFPVWAIWLLGWCAVFFSILMIALRRAKLTIGTTLKCYTALVTGKFSLVIRRIIALAGTVFALIISWMELLSTGKAFFIFVFCFARLASSKNATALTRTTMTATSSLLWCKGSPTYFTVCGFGLVVFFPTITGTKEAFFSTFKYYVAKLTYFLHDSLARISRILLGEQDGASNHLFGPRSLVPGPIITYGG